MNVMKLIKQAQSMQKNIEKLQAELAERTYEFSAGGGAVKVTAKGDLTISRIDLAPAAVDPQDEETLQDLVLTAVNGALQQARQAVQEETAKITGGMGGLPGFG